MTPNQSGMPSGKRLPAHGSAASFEDPLEPQASTTGASMTLLERGVVAVAGASLAALGLRGHPFARIALMGAGIGLSIVAAQGKNPLATALKIQQDPDTGETLVSDAVTIAKPADALYAIWRKLDNLPQLMTHLQEVRVLDDKRSHWTVKAPVGTVGWDAEITADEPGQRIAWQSLPGASIDNSGEVIFRTAPGKRGTEVIVRLRYKPPGGTAGAVVARIAGQEPSQQLRDDLMRFKREQELGFAPTTEGQTSGRAASEAKKLAGKGEQMQGNKQRSKQADGGTQ
ncbi:cyclase [Deinococcus sp. Arct2-2]|uniref:SRPBCC family protein n=1 Tax=Deinococcus sp. Arct2-2 TaxID=2568653 RepID=UPI0010A598BF|nr:SRPBCC family protein [Deinococcus sp. Arct2-2]THF70284.1 cyclase [Deinococcus sp. Arct2-2]